MSTRGGGDSRCGEKGGAINAKKGRKKGKRFFLKCRGKERMTNGSLDSIVTLPAKNLSYARDLMDGEARSCVENSRRENHPKLFEPGNRSKSGPVRLRSESGVLLPLFFSSLLPLSVYLRPLVSSAGSTGLFIFAASKRVTDDGTMLIIPPMWEPIVTRSYRGSMTKTGIVRFCRRDYIRRIDLEKNQREPTLLVEDIYTCPYREEEGNVKWRD